MNQMQLAAANHKDGPCLVVAAAGSGKTTVLTKRIENLLADGVPPGELLCCTFTKKAAEEMASRIYKKTKKKVATTTIHGLAYKMNKEVMQGEDWKLTSDPHWIIERAIQETGASIGTEDALSKISWFKNRMIEPAQITDVNLRNILRIYEAIKKDKKYLDFTDLLIMAIKRMETDHEFRRKWQKQYQFVCVDEYQDTSLAQWSLIRLLAQRHRNVWVCGDDFQSIMSFNGADPELMMNFHREYPNVRQIIMGINYRSTEAILKAAGKLIDTNPNQIRKDVTANRTGGEPVTIMKVIDEEEEAEKIAQQIQRIKKKNPSIPYSDFAILYRTNQQSRPFEEAFMAYDIPFVVFGDSHFYEMPSVRFLLDCLNVVSSLQEQIEPDTGQLTKLMRIFVTDYLIIKQIQNEGMAYIRNEKNMKLERLILDSWQSIEQPAELLEEIFKQTTDGKKIAEKKEEAPTWFLSLKRSAHKHATVEEYLRHIERVLELPKEKKEDACQLMTMHRSKGLEFQVVFLADLVEGIVPYKRSLEEDNLEEEVRVLYVGMTRAKNQLYLMVPQYIGENAISPSRFINSFSSECKIYE